MGGNFNIKKIDKAKAEGRDRPPPKKKLSAASSKSDERDDSWMSPPAPQPATNEITFSIEGGKLRISALVDKEGAAKLLRIVAANKDFLAG